MIAVSAAPIDDAVFRFAQQSSSDFLVGGNINSIETEADSRILQRQAEKEVRLRLLPNTSVISMPACSNLRRQSNAFRVKKPGISLDAT